MESRLPWPTLDSLITESSEPPRWLVQDLFYQQSLICLAGVSGVGKSTFCYSLAIAVASGQPFLNLASTPGRVLYFDEENGPANMPTYFRWAWRGRGCPDLLQLSENLRVGQAAILSHNGPWLDAMLQQAREFRPNLIICDTATPCFRIQDENDNAEATRIIGSLRMLQAAADASTSILILRHARIERDMTGQRPDFYKMRGASAWGNATDATIFHLAPPGNYHGLRPTYLLPDKTRAYGLRTKLTITPRWTSADEQTRGLELAGSLDPQIN